MVTENLLVDKPFFCQWNINEKVFITIEKNMKNPENIIQCIDLLHQVLPYIPKIQIKNLYNNKLTNTIICKRKINETETEIIGCLIFRINVALFVEIVLMGVKPNLQSTSKNEEYKKIGSFMVDCLKRIIPMYTNSIFVKSCNLCTKFYEKNGFCKNIVLPLVVINQNGIFETTESTKMENRRENGTFEIYKSIKKPDNDLVLVKD